jgi:hypothetical protein
MAESFQKAEQILQNDGHVQLHDGRTCCV